MLTLPRPLETDIMNFCKVNEISDVESFLVSCLRDGFNIAKFGTSPQENFKNENKPLKINKNDDYKEESNSERVEEVKETPKRRGRPRKETRKEESLPTEEVEEPVKPKKKIRIIKN